VDVIALDGRGYSKFLAAGTYFLRKYRQVLNDLNVFPVPDGDTGTNMYLTLRAAMLEAGKLKDGDPISEVAAQAAHGSLMGARGNSGVIISQMLRGFAHHLRHRRDVDTFAVATAMKEAVAAAKSALLRPVDGTIISVAEAAAEAAYTTALKERDFYRFVRAVLRAANEALDRTPDQLPVLKEAGVVDSGGAGFVFFLEGILAFLPDVKVRQYCTEFVLEGAKCSVVELRHWLEPRGESLLVIGAEPTIKVHIHTDDPERVKEISGRHGTLTRLKVDNMEQQHNVLVVEKPAVAYSIVSVVPGPGFEQIVRELGTEVVVSGAKNPSVRDLLLAVNKCLSDEIYLFVNDKNVALAASEVVKLTDKHVHVVPSRDIVAGIAGLFAFRTSTENAPSEDAIRAACEHGSSAQVFFAGKDATIGGTAVAAGKPAAAFAGCLVGGETLDEAAATALREMGAAAGGLITIYYGGVQKEKDAQRIGAELEAAFPGADVEYYYGGMKNAEYWLSFDE
jgi:DAK2 domain fusion protein YloV